MRFYDRDAVAASLPYGPLIDALEDAFRQQATVPARQHHRIEVPQRADATLLLMPAWRAGQAIGVKVATIFPGNIDKGLPSVNASYLLLDANTGQPVAVLDGTEITLRRTAAASALASRYLSRKDAKSLLMVGTGKLAPHLVSAHATVRDLDTVMIWGRRPERALELGGTLAPGSFSVSVVDDLESAVRRADIVSCATLATEPLVEGHWLHPGQHLDLVGAFRPDMREADSEAIARSEVYVDTFEGALAEAGEIVQAMGSGKLVRDDIRGDLYSLARGTCPARESADAITLFKSVGSAIEDLAAAELAIARAPPQEIA